MVGEPTEAGAEAVRRLSRMQRLAHQGVINIHILISRTRVGADEGYVQASLRVKTLGCIDGGTGGSGPQIEPGACEHPAVAA